MWRAVERFRQIHINRSYCDYNDAPFGTFVERQMETSSKNCENDNLELGYNGFEFPIKFSIQ